MKSRLIGLLKKSLTALLLISLTMAAVTVITIMVSGDSNYQPPALTETVNDITRLNPIHVAQVIQPASIKQVQDALTRTKGPVSIGGGRYSQGGQTAYPDSLHLDMRQFNKVLRIDTKQKLVTVQTGVTWRALQEQIDPHNLSIKIMQTYANFTVGGSLSVNVHGRYVGEGPLIHSVKSIAVVLADGELKQASPTENSELFYGAIGGYGGLGVIVEATLQLVNNERIEQHVSTMSVTDYAQHFANQVRNNDQVVFHNADIYPPAYEQVRDVSWHKTKLPVTLTDRLHAIDAEYPWQPLVAGLVADSDLGKWARENLFDPLYYLKTRRVWRNWEASYDVKELEPKRRDKQTYALREYFVPVKNFDTFVVNMRDIFQRHDANVINVSVRHTKPDTGSLLAWAREESFAFVVYYRQDTDTAAQQQVKQWSVEMIDATIDAGGSYYLPYQVFASPAQFKQAYPGADQYFALKARLDPNNRFRNMLWQQHYPANQNGLASAQAAIPDYARGEEQTFLTVPEWYLVFAPHEYANYLDQGQDPSRFPFLDAIDEYWTLYDRVSAISAQNYPENAEYRTMLQVIGISTTVEYLAKWGYEATLGRATRWSANHNDVPEEQIMRQAHRAYSKLIYDEPWYEFDFGGWIPKIWSTTNFFGPNFIRKTERKLLFTAEFSVKAIYAGLIKKAVLSTSGETDKKIYLTAIAPADIDPPIFPGVTIHAAEGNRSLLSVPRWGGFTTTLPKLASAGWRFEDISGNHQIVVSLTGNTSSHFSELPGRELFRSRIVAAPEKQRTIILVPVATLNQFLLQVTQSELTLEHIFDY